LLRSSEFAEVGEKILPRHGAHLGQAFEVQLLLTSGLRFAFRKLRHSAAGARSAPLQPLTLANNPRPNGLACSW